MKTATSRSALSVSPWRDTSKGGAVRMSRASGEVVARVKPSAGGFAWETFREVGRRMVSAAKGTAGSLVAAQNAADAT